MCALLLITQFSRFGRAQGSLLPHHLTGRQAPLLQGKYKDSEGQVYEFIKEKIAIWPNVTFSYMPYDLIEGWDCNPICIIDQDGKSTDEYYGYLFIDGKLNIFNIELGQPMGYIRDQEPFLILEKIN